MFIIVGHNITEKKVRIFDTTDNTSGWYSYGFMNKGINLGITVRGINSEGIIRCQQVNILKELEESISDLVHSYRVYNTSEPLLEYLQAYGLADSMSDIVLNDTTIRIKRLGKDIKLETYAMSDSAIKEEELKVQEEYAKQMKEQIEDDHYKLERQTRFITEEAKKLYKHYGCYKPDLDDTIEYIESWHRDQDRMYNTTFIHLLSKGIKNIYAENVATAIISDLLKLPNFQYKNLNRYVRVIERGNNHFDIISSLPLLETYNYLKIVYKTTEPGKYVIESLEKLYESVDNYFRYNAVYEEEILTGELYVTIEDDLTVIVDDGDLPNNGKVTLDDVITHEKGNIYDYYKNYGYLDSIECERAVIKVEEQVKEHWALIQEGLQKHPYMI